MDSSEEITAVDVPPLLAGRYRIEAMLGTGGMGSVYRVRDVELDDVVALKIVGPLEDAALARFRDEVKLARRVTHPNVARTFDIGVHGGVRFLTMEYVPGGSLRRRLAREQLSEATARRLAAGMCAGIAAIHDAGVIHGDVKPENIVITPDDVPKVSDFGLALLRGARTTRRGGGTPLYMAPEQHLGAPPDQRTDLYAIGVVLHELFSGQRPGGKAASPRVPASIASIVERCIDPDPLRRPRDLAEVIAALGPAAGASEPRGRTGARLRPDDQAITVAVRTLHADDPSDAYLGPALAGDVARALANSRGLILRGDLLAPGADPADVDAGDVDAVIDGTVRRIDRRLQISLRLVSRREGYLLWGRTVSVELVGVLASIADAAVAIAAALGTQATPRGPVALRDPRLVELYLHARELDSTTWHAHDTDNVALYQQILEEVPDDPLILASCADALTRRAFRQPGARVLAQSYAERALVLAPDLAQAHHAIAIVLFLGNDNEGAIRAMVRGLELAPSSAYGQALLGYSMCELGFVDRGLGQLELALALDPDLPIAWSNAVRYHELAGHTARVDELIANPPPLRAIDSEWLYWVTRSRIAVWRGIDVARAVADELAASPYGGTPLLRPLVEGLRGIEPAPSLDSAMQPFFLGDRDNHRQRAFGHQYAAELAWFLGRRDLVREHLVACVEEGAGEIAWWDAHPMTEPLRGEAWFIDARSKVAARAERARGALASVAGAIT